MKKSRLKLFILSALLIAAVISILPAPHGAKAAAGPQIVGISTPAGSTLADRWDGVVDITFDQPVQASGAHDAGSQITLYWKYINPSTKLVEDKAIWQDYSDGSGKGNVSISADGKTVRLDMGQNALSYIEGDKYNIYGNDYKFKYWVRLPAGAFVSQADPSVNAEGWVDESYTVYVQSLPPKVESAYPASGAAHVIATADAEFRVTFDQNVSVKPAVYPVIYQYDPGASSWAEAPKWVCSVSNISPNVLTFKLPQALPNNKIFGIMIPGPANKAGSDSDFIINSISTPFPGIDMPDTYAELPHAGCWSFTTALNYATPAMSSYTPDAGELHIDPHTALTMTFDQPIRSVTSSEKNVYIRKYSDGSEVIKIRNTAIQAADSYATTLTIPDQSLSKNTEYYVTIDPGAFENSDGTNYAGLTDNGWHFTTIETYTVEFRSDGVQFGETQIVDYRGSAVDPGKPTKVGFIFVGWDKSLENVTENLIINAVYKKQYTLTYIAGEHGHIEGVSPQEVAEGESGKQVTAVPDVGYHFVKWSDGKTDASRIDTATEDKSFTAEFTLNTSGTCTLKYAAGAHGSVTGDLDQSVEYGGTGTQVTAKPGAHYHFEKWSDGRVTADRIDKNVMKDVNVTAEFAINKYKVTFKDYDGDVLKTQNVAYGADAAPPEDPEREGYTFTGWDGDYENITETTVLKAEYDKSMYKVSFVDYDEAVLKTQSVIHGAGATPPEDPKREGYAFTGWDGDYKKITGIITITAQYRANILKVRFVDYDGSAIDEQDVEYGKNAAAPADPIRKGFIFTGWDKEFIGVKADITVTAQYKAALVVTKAGIQNGNPAIVLKTGGLDIKGASVEGGKAIVNQDGTITLEFLSKIKAGDVEVTLKLADGTTLRETVRITDEAAAAMVTDQAGTPVWLWITIGSLAVIAAALITFFVRRSRRVR